MKTFKVFLILLILRWRTVKDSESILLTNVLLPFPVKYFVSREKMLSKKTCTWVNLFWVYYRVFNSCKWFQTHILKVWLKSHLNYQFRLCLKVDNLVNLFFPLISSNNWEIIKQSIFTLRTQLLYFVQQRFPEFCCFPAKVFIYVKITFFKLVYILQHDSLILKLCYS